MARDYRALYAKRLTDPNYKEALRQPLYDTQVFVSNTTAQLRFFTSPVGGTRTFEDTNMQLAGQLPKGHKFVADGIEVHVMPGSVVGAAYTRQQPFLQSAAVATPNFANDVWALGERGYLEVIVNSKPYLDDGPLYRFAPAQGLVMAPGADQNLAAAAAQTISCDYARFAGRPYLLLPELPIDENTAFSLTLNWAAAFALPSTFTAKIKVILLGTYFRN